MLDAFIDQLNVTLVSDSRCEVSYQLHNDGTEKTNGFYTNFYLSPDSRLDRLDSLIQSRKDVLAAAQDKDIDLLLNLDRRGGYLILQTDSRNRLRESNEENNVTSVPLTGVDLTISNGRVTVNPDGLTVAYTTKNQGNRSTGRFSNSVLLDGTPLLTTAINGLKAGQQKGFTHTFNLDLQPGRHTLSILADSRNEIREMNEDNNRLLLDTDVPMGQPDLVITDIWVLEKLPNGQIRLSKGR